MAHVCEWCRKPIGFCDAQTASWNSFWHTHCWNEAAAQRAAFLEELDDAEGFSIPPLPDELTKSETGSRRSEVIDHYGNPTEPSAA